MKQKIITMRGVLSAVKLTAIALLSIGLMLPFMSSSVSAATGPVVDEVPILNGSDTTSYVAAGPDGTMWVTREDSLTVQRINADDTVTEITIPGASTASFVSVGGITMGPDNAMWLANFSNNSIDRIAMDNTVTQFAIPTPNSGARTIALGSDGALWFTAQTAMAIGRVTTDGTFSQFPLQNLGVPRNITAGVDGELWFTQSLGFGGEGGRINKVAMDGTITSYDLPSGPTSLALGPDGAMWVTLASSIVRVQSDGTMTQFAGPTDPDITINSITGRLDGAMWISYGVPSSADPTQFDLHFARVNTDGSLVPVSDVIAQASGSLGSAAGPNNTVWFTLSKSAAGAQPTIARISLGEVPDAVSVAPTAAADPAAQLAYTGQPMSIIAGIATVTVVAGIGLAVTARRRARA